MPSSLRLVSLAALPLLLAACPERAERVAAPPAFDHAAHLERGPACADCHGAAGGVRPEAETCRTCHADGVEYAAASIAPRETYGLIFDHPKHASAGIECSTCHVIDGPKARRPRMSTCLDACHGEGEEIPLACDSCHRDLSADGAPTSHAADWRRGHGLTARAGRNDCRSCHAEETCVTCHEREKPADHGPHFRTRGHGTIASFERERCSTCHTQESCTRCHMRTQPRTHTAAWKGDATYTHCRNCHLPMTTTSCGTCHAFFYDRHTAAPAWPTNSTHVTGASCRTCHAGPGAGLTHPDNGDDCEACHAK